MPKNSKFYMVGLAAIYWAIWQARNNVCFERKKIRSPTEIICSTSSFLKYWAGLQKGEEKEMLEVGAEALKNAALHHHPQEQEQEESRSGTVLSHPVLKAKPNALITCAPGSSYTHA
jgi:hypothetical protein